MKKYIVLLILVILFGFTFAFRRPLYNLYRTYFVKEEKEVTLPIVSKPYRYELHRNRDTGCLDYRAESICRCARLFYGSLEENGF